MFILVAFGGRAELLVEPSISFEVRQLVPRLSIIRTGLFVEGGSGRVKWSRLPVKRKAMSSMSMKRLSRARASGA
jgi:hypothetical protein